MSKGDPWIVLQHVAFEGPGALGPAIGATGAPLSVVRLDLGQPVPAPADIAAMAGLVALGGPMGVHDDLGWLGPERALLRAAVETGLPVLGVCLAPSSWPPHSVERSCGDPRPKSGWARST